MCHKLELFSQSVRRSSQTVAPSVLPRQHYGTVCLLTSLTLSRSTLPAMLLPVYCSSWVVCCRPRRWRVLEVSVLIRCWLMQCEYIQPLYYIAFYKTRPRPVLTDTQHISHDRRQSLNPHHLFYTDATHHHQPANRYAAPFIYSTFHRRYACAVTAKLLERPPPRGASTG